MKAVLLDRDGVLNALVYHEDAGLIDSPADPSQFQLLPQVPEAIRLLTDLGLRIAIVSNQPGVAKGKFNLDTLTSFDQTILARVSQMGGKIDGIYYCLHHPDAVVGKYRQSCECRKPGIGLLRKAAEELRVSLHDCYMIGDGIPDLIAGKRAGCRTIFIGRWKCEICQFTEDPNIRPALVADSLWSAATLVRSELRGVSIAGAELSNVRPAGTNL